VTGPVITGIAAWRPRKRSRKVRGKMAGQLTPRGPWSGTMIVENEKDVTNAVLNEIARGKNPRLREVLSAFVRHLHDFAREVKLTE
jgi:Catechol dioxygenase N terminus